MLYVIMPGAADMFPIAFSYLFLCPCILYRLERKANSILHVFMHLEETCM